ncbi:MAG TPA: DNA primase [Clostridiales bacterium]|nr:DNA primase [Clostridiales bacterium]
MYYPEELVEEVRNRNDIVSVIGSYIKLQKKGNNHMGLCPFHNEKTPSFSVSPSKQMYHCFGCGVGGNVFTFIMEYENYTFVEALKQLADQAGVQLPEEEYSKEARERADFRTRLLDVNKEAAKYFYYQLKSDRGQAAYNYLLGRDMSEEIIKQFGLGYSNKYRDDLYQYLKKQGYSDDFLKQTGLVTFNEKDGANDKFWNRVMFPIMDANHRVVGFGGRVMGDGMPKYLNSPETMVFDKSRILYGLNIAKSSRKSSLLVCEGYMDVIALHQAGFTNAVAALGTAYTSSHGNLMKRYTSEALLTFDSDGAGIQATLRAIPILKDAGLTVKVVNMKPYKDPDDFIKAMGAQEYQKRIDEAQNSFFFEIDVLQSQYDMSDPEQKTRFFNETAKKLLDFREELERNFYIDAIAKKYMIDVEQLQRLVNRRGSQLIGTRYNTVEKSRRVGPGGKNKDDGIIKSQKLLLTWLIEDNSLFHKIKDIIEPEDFTEGMCKDVAILVFDQFDKERKVIPAKIINHFESKEEQSEVAALFSAAIKGEMDKSDLNKALTDTLFKLKEYSLNKQSEKAIEVNDTALLQQIILKKAQLNKHSFNLKF